MKKNKIFISIASYRDPELLPTIEDCLSKADNPKNLIFGISREYHPEDGFDNLSKYQKNKNFKIIDTHYKKSSGVCNSRNKIQKLFNDEEYYLQLDSHHRFIKGWDTKLINLLESLKSTKCTHPIISSYLPPYEPNSSKDSKVETVWRTYIDRFMPEGPIFIFPEEIKNWKKKKTPEKARFLSGHCIFSNGSFVKDVPYDPNLYFHGEESSLAVRAYTHGYDLFHLHRPWIWHFYERSGAKRHWEDSSKWNKLNKESFQRYRNLLGMDSLKRVNYPKYGLGSKRSLEDYELYAGISFKDRKIHQKTIDRTPPPIAKSMTSDYESKLSSMFKYCIDLDKSLFTESDYDVWVMAFKDSNENEMIRLDAGESEVNHLLQSNPQDNFVRFWREFSTSTIPRKWLVWPHSKSKGWMNRIEGEVPVA